MLIPRKQRPKRILKRAVSNKVIRVGQAVFIKMHCNDKEAAMEKLFHLIKVFVRGSFHVFPADQAMILSKILPLLNRALPGLWHNMLQGYLPGPANRKCAEKHPVSIILVV